MISLVVKPAKDGNFIQLIQRLGWTYKDNQKQAKIFGQRKVFDNPSMNWEKQRDLSRSTDVIKLKIAAENYIDQFKTLKDQINFTQNERELKGDNRLWKKSKTNWEGKMYTQLTISILK
jgi:hypothetical protein